MQAFQGKSSQVDDIEVATENIRIPLEVSSRPIFGEQGGIQYAVSVFSGHYRTETNRA